MVIKQVSVFLQNSKGRLAEVLDILAKSAINIRALCIADTNDFGVLRIIVSNPDKAIDVLKKSNYLVSASDVMAIEVPDNPGGLASSLKILRDEDISVEYMYAFVGTIKNANSAFVIVRLDDTKKAMELYKQGKISLVDPSEVYNL